MQVLKLTWIPTGQVFAQPKTFEEAVAAATTKALRAGCRCFSVSVGDDGDTFRLFRHSDDTEALVSCELGARVHSAGAAKPQRSYLQNTQGKPPASGWYKGQGRRFDLAAGDPRREGPYFLAAVDTEDGVLAYHNIEPLVQKTGLAGAEYPLDAALACAEVGGLLQAAKDQGATFALVLRDDAPPKLRFNQKWGSNEGPRSMQVVYRRPL